MPSQSKFRYFFHLALTVTLSLFSYTTSVNGEQFSDAFLDCDASGYTKRNVNASSYNSNGLTDQVQWDFNSLILKDQRIFLHSGEFHTYRLPVPSLWLDILQKVKAAGLNSVSIYTHWGQINPSPGVIDFDGYRALQPLFDAAKATGIWVVLRPGPYINAETTAGGIAHWVTTEVAGTLRKNSTDFRDSWQDYVSAIINVTRPNQITEGGPVIAVQIDNEYDQWGVGNREYFQQLEDAYRTGGIVVPLTYNDPNQGKNFVNGTGAVDIYGFDAYPQNFDCTNPETWSPVPGNYHQYHLDTNPNQPLYIPEFQGGAFDAWGPQAPGYPACRILTGPEFEQVFYKALWAANAKMINYYMFYGGTSWGAIPFPGVYTSYDYGSAIQENRLLTSKYTELKLQGLFLRSSPDFYRTDWIGNSTSAGVNVSNPNAFVVLLANPETGSKFYITRQNDSTSTAVTEFSLTVATSNGTFAIPKSFSSITLNGRESKVIVVDYRFGDLSSLLYSTASVLFAGRIGERDVLFLYGDHSQQHEFAVNLRGSSDAVYDNRVSRSGGQSGLTTISINGNLTGLVTVFDSDSQLILYGDTSTAGTFFAPLIPSNETDGETAMFSNFWQFGSNKTILVGGPYLVRNATIIGSELQLRGDLNGSTTLTVFAPSEVESATWNGRPIESLNRTSNYSGSFTALLETNLTRSTITLPQLTDWKFSDSLPEIQTNFSDEAWAVANHTSTNSPFKPYYGDGRVLYGCDYGFCENVVIWRGHFNATGSETSVNLSINGGQAFAASVWLNNVFLNTSFGNSTNNNNILEEIDDVFIFPEDAILAGQDNIITVVQDNMGLNQTRRLDNTSFTNTSKSPRGIRGFQLNKGNFSEWKVQGKVGGYTNYPDKVRGVLNEGGLFGEREGWHLPGFDTSSWENRNLSDALPGGGPGIGFFVTTFNLSIPDGTDVPISLVFDGGLNSTYQPYRALLFVNGWHMGKRVANIGPQTKFPVHQGILDYQGENTVAVALWSLLPNATIAPTLEAVIDGALEGGVGGIVTNNPGLSSRI